MPVISIVGNVDKRIVAIPLARGLSIDGKTAIITDDTSFKRLYKSGSKLGSIDGIDIVVDTQLSDNSVEALKETYENYKYYVYVSDTFIPEGASIHLICRGKDRSLLNDDIAQTFGAEDKDGKPLLNSREIILTVSDHDKKDINAIKVTEQHYKYLGQLEETKTLEPVKDAMLAKKIASIVGNDCGVNGKTLELLMTRKKILDSKK